MTTDAERDPVNVLGELIEDAVTRYSGRIGTLASATVAQEVIDLLRSDPGLAASVLDAQLWDDVTPGESPVVVLWRASVPQVRTVETGVAEPGQ